MNEPLRRGRAGSSIRGAALAALTAFFLLAVSCGSPLLGGTGLAAGGTAVVTPRFGMPAHRSITAAAAASLGLPAHRQATLELASDFPDRRDKMRNFPASELPTSEFSANAQVQEFLWWVLEKTVSPAEPMGVTDQQWAHAMLTRPGESEPLFGDMPRHFADTIFNANPSADHALYPGRSLRSAFNDGEAQWKDFLIGALAHYVEDSTFALHNSWFLPEDVAPGSDLGHAMLWSQDAMNNRGAAWELKRQYQRFLDGGTEYVFKGFLFKPRWLGMSAAGELNVMMQTQAHFRLEDYMDAIMPEVLPEAIAQGEANPYHGWETVDYDDYQAVRRAFIDAALGGSYHHPNGIGKRLVDYWVLASMPLAEGDRGYADPALRAAVRDLMAYTYAASKAFLEWALDRNLTRYGDGGYARSGLFIHRGGDMKYPLTILPLEPAQTVTLDESALRELGVLATPVQGVPTPQAYVAPGAIYSPTGDVWFHGTLSDGSAFQASVGPGGGEWTGDNGSGYGFFYLGPNAQYTANPEIGGRFVRTLRQVVSLTASAQYNGGVPWEPPAQIEDIPDRSDDAGSRVSGRFRALDGEEQACYSWSASGLPPGIVLNTHTGEYSGELAAHGAYAVTVTGTAEGSSDSDSFLWTVNYVPRVTMMTAGGSQVPEGGEDVVRCDEFLLLFSEPVDPQTLNRSTVTVTASDPRWAIGQDYGIVPAADGLSCRVVPRPNAYEPGLYFGARYTVTVSGARGLGGRTIRTWTRAFTVRDDPYENAWGEPVGNERYPTGLRGLAWDDSQQGQYRLDFLAPGNFGAARLWDQDIYVMQLDDQYLHDFIYDYGIRYLVVTVTACDALGIPASLPAGRGLDIEYWNDSSSALDLYLFMDEPSEKVLVVDLGSVDWELWDAQFGLTIGSQQYAGQRYRVELDFSRSPPM